MDWKKVLLFAGGVLFGSYGLKALCSEDAKEVYTNTTAAAFRVKDEVMKDVMTVRENAEDIAAAAKEKNERRRAAEEGRIIEDDAAEAAETEEIG